MRGTWTVRGALVALVAWGAVAALPGAAAAPLGSGGEDGYAATVTVRLSGDGAPASGGTVARVAPSCWWTVADGPAEDAVAMKEWFISTTGQINGSFTVARPMYGSAADWDAAIAREAAGEDLTWYVARCQDWDKVLDYVPSTYNGGVNGTLPVTYAAFTAGAPPVPEVDPEQLAIVARDAMVVPEPALDHNPKAADLGGGTLVGLSTWFWTADPQAVGTDGELSVRAEVGAVWAEVTARTGGMTLTSPAGGTTCGVEAAQTAWGPGVDESAACTVAFSRASVGRPSGFPVTATATWQAQWVGSGGTGGALQGLTRQASVAVPVLEVQTLVTDAR